MNKIASVTQLTSVNSYYVKKHEVFAFALFKIPTEPGVLYYIVHFGYEPTERSTGWEIDRGKPGYGHQSYSSFRLDFIYD